MTEKQKAKFQAGTGDNQPTRLKDLARRMRQRFERGQRTPSAETGVTAVTPEATSKTTSSTPASGRRSSKRVKLDPEADAVQPQKLSVRRRSTVTSETESVWSLTYESDLPDDGGCSQREEEAMDSADEIGRGLTATTLQSASSDSDRGTPQEARIVIRTQTSPRTGGGNFLDLPSQSSMTLMTTRTLPADTVLQNLRQAL